MNPPSVALLALALAAVPAPASEPGAWPAGVESQRVGEPVLGGEVVLYRAGTRGAPPVVLVHGLGPSGARDWRHQLPVLAADFEVFALDLPGFGASDKGSRLYTPEAFVKVLEAVIGPRVRAPFALVGHSMGAAVALAYAAAHPGRVGRLVLVDMAGVLHRAVYAEFLSRLAAELATGVYPEDAPWFDALVRRVLTRAENLPFARDLVLRIEPLRQRMFRGEPNAIAAYALVEHDFSAALRDVRAPTLVVWGREDKVAPLRTGQAAAAVIPGARLVVIDGAGHSPPLQTPDRFNALLLDELRGRPVAAPYALPAAAHPGTRVARCEGEGGRRFTGDYARLVLERCPGAVIEEARVGELRISDGDVRIVNSRVAALRATRAALELTGGVLGGEPPLVLDAARVDAAGTRFEGRGEVAANAGTEPLRLYFSVCELAGSGGRRYLHETVDLPPRR